MKYCLASNYAQKIKNIHKNRTDKIKLPPTDKKINTKVNRLKKDPLYGWLNMTKEDSPYYIFDIMNETRLWRKWFKTTIKGIGVKMRRYQIKYHSIK